MTHMTQPLKRTASLLSVTALSLAIVGCANNGTDTEAKTASAITEQSTELQKVGYSFGYLSGRDGKDVLDDLDLDAFEQGMRDAYADKESALTDEQMQTVMATYQERKQKEMMEKMQKEGVENKAAGDKFLAENANKEGVQTTASGLQYKVLKAGTGASPSEQDVVEVNYEGKLIDGEVFDSSYERGEPAYFPVAQVVPGFAEGLQLMKEGGKYELYIPADLGYGETGTPSIPSNSTLIFTVDMIKVNPELPQMPAQPTQ